MPAECANPLLLEWVGEWLQNARERNSKGVTTYKNAYNSLKSCPLVFQHPSEAQQLHGFGPVLCQRLTDKLKAHCEENGLPMPKMAHRSRESTKEGDDEATSNKAKKPRKPKAYVPTLRSGAYAIILALSTIDENSPTGLTKTQTIELAQPHCDSSFTAPSDPTKFYTAWSSMKTLLEKDIVYERGRPLRKYALTEEGWEVAKRIKGTIGSNQPSLDAPVNRANHTDAFPEPNLSPVRPTWNDPPFDTIEREDMPDIVPIGDAISDESSLPTFSPITIPPSSFTVELVLDVREVRAKTDRDYIQNELSKKGVPPIMRSLEVGDALWVAKCKDPKFLGQLGLEGDEIVLDWIVERKRLDDLVGSIKDGRFDEQKFRLRKSGMKNVIYIIEEMSVTTEHFGRYEEAVQSAIASMQVVNGYFVKKTQMMDETIRYLTRMTKLLKSAYEAKPIQIIPTSVLTTQNYNPLITQLRKKTSDQSFNITYPAFASLASKSESLTLRDVYLKMLMCTRGVTGEKALEIQRRWKTPLEFAKALEKCGPGEAGKKRKREFVVGEMGNLVGRKKIGKAVSQKIAEVWSDA